MLKPAAAADEEFTAYEYREEMQMVFEARWWPRTDGLVCRCGGRGGSRRSDSIVAVVTRVGLCRV